MARIGGRWEVKSTSQFLSILLWLVFPFLSACSQNVDIYFHPDESWQVKSHLSFSAQEMLLFRGVVQDYLVKITQKAIPSQLLQVDDWPAPALDLLKAYYANQGIEFRWQKLFNSYTMEADGKSLDEFKGLLPSSIAIEKLQDDQYHLNINLGNANMFASLIYKQSVTLHAQKIIASNAPHQAGGTAIWNNPSEIDVTFVSTSQISFAWLVVLLILVLIITAVAIMIKLHTSKISKATTIDRLTTDTQIT